MAVPLLPPPSTWPLLVLFLLLSSLTPYCLFISHLFLPSSLPFTSTSSLSLPCFPCPPFPPPTFFPLSLLPPLLPFTCECSQLHQGREWHKPRLGHCGEKWLAQLCAPQRQQESGEEYKWAIETGGISYIRTSTYEFLFHMYLTDLAHWFASVVYLL